MSRLEKGHSEATAATVGSLAEALGYPEEFFFLPDVPGLSGEAVSFRGLKSASVREREAARAAAELGVNVARWLDRSFALPEPDLPDLSFMSETDAAARSLRQACGLGERPVASMVALLEAKEVRVFSLGEDTQAIDAFSFWQDGIPFVFLTRLGISIHREARSARRLTTQPGCRLRSKRLATVPMSLEQGYSCEGYRMRSA